MKTIEQTYVIPGLQEEVWDALTNADLIASWSAAPASFSPEVGTEYSLWNGDIRGRILEVKPYTRLVQSWRPDNYAEDSRVTFRLTPTAKGTQVDLLHENVPDWDYEATNEGWDVYYFGPIKKLVESRSKKSKVARKQSVAKEKRGAKLARIGSKKAPPSKKAAVRRTAPAKTKRSVKKTAKK